MATTGEFIGLRESNAALRKLPYFAKANVQQAIDTTAFHVEQGAKQRVRRRTGFLLMRIKRQSRPRTVSAVVGVENEAFYWKFLEYGTVKMGAFPFMRPAADAAKAGHEQRMNRALEESANQVERSAGSRFL